jgi:chromatin segregation and condensation protein Rec8/ScpA/Scc1 (kleisin family)
MLELVREGIIDVMQNSTFADINISKQEALEIQPLQIQN